MYHTLIYSILPLVAGWGADRLFGDPERLPHPVVWMGRAISWCERTLNHPPHRVEKGAITAIGLIVATYLISWLTLWLLSPIPPAEILAMAILVFFCLAGTTLCREVRMVFEAADRSLEEGRRQVGRIVGRDTANLSDHEVRTAALETLAENLSDGVIAPMFYYILLGVPGMLAYKMVNTLDSMIAYHTERYLLFGRWAARIDDIANYIPSRLTAILMLLAAGRLDCWGFVRRYGPQHASPNSGWPEAALAGILNCRFGGPHDYFGQSFPKPYIGTNPRPLTSDDMLKAIRINRRAELLMLLIAIILIPLLQ
ncbi:MAG: adenosylcobinamide-phosphate synthase CbiB [Muribaculaceae bacterium]|nr:adenosylcobinamide-phosphate synthase CbiB [Muribaculaceae bacterium]